MPITDLQRLHYYIFSLLSLRLQTEIDAENTTFYFGPFRKTLFVLLFSLSPHDFPIIYLLQLEDPKDSFKTILGQNGKLDWPVMTGIGNFE